LQHFADDIGSRLDACEGEFPIRIRRCQDVGDCSGVGEGVSELRIHFGPGYRVYFGTVGETLVVLLVAGDKSTQNADIKKAKQFWREYKAEKEDADD
jgi:putative addiction module killer protein